MHFYPYLFINTHYTQPLPSKRTSSPNTHWFNKFFTCLNTFDNLYRLLGLGRNMHVIKSQNSMEYSLPYGEHRSSGNGAFPFNKANFITTSIDIYI